MYISYNQLNPNDEKQDNIQYEGVGSQYQRIVTLLSIAKRHNLKYIHFPIKIGHNYNNDPEWNNKWDKMFNIKKLSDNIDNLTIKNKIYKDCPNSLEELLKNNENTDSTLVLYSHSLNIFDNNPDYYLTNIQADLINAYDENNSNRILIYDKTKTNIAIHIRVYNPDDIKSDYDDYMNYNTDNIIDKYNKNKRYYMTSNSYLFLIKILKEKYSNSDIHIFSGNEYYFDIYYKELKEIKDIKIHFNDLDTFDTFHHLCKSDVLVMGTSSFSILSAFYNKNTVIYLPYMHPPSLKSWLIYNPLN
jgi:hypothetical protein